MVARAITVAQMLPDLDEGGVEQGTLEIGRFLSRLGHRSLVISRGGRLVERLEAEGSRHITMPFIGEKSPRALIHLLPLRRLLKALAVDVLHLRSRLPAWIGFGAWKSLPPAARPRLVTTFHGFYSINAYSGVMARGEKIIAVSNTIAAHIRSAYHVSGERIETIYRGVDPDVFDGQRVSAQRIERLRKQWAITEGRSPLLLIPARVTRLKGHDILIQALGRLREKSWTLVCAGDFEPQSDYFRQLRRMCTEGAIASRILFVGHCDDMPAAMRLADLVVSASTKPESFGRTLIEAQALERPVIAPGHGGSLETVQEGRTGWLFDPGSVEHLVKILDQALGADQEWVKIGQRGRQQVLKRFTLSQMCRHTLDLYQNLLAQ